ncbi:hypothetical protein [Clavibacter sp. MX14-G9D]|uniref:hypothetical protein n=1 Tax=Clavibacter sp. MX14-G9D TaxID=3064656 RepID=UPI00293E0606|nr:hypothetical protein [Clavibacter sp. MX14-G9D]
MSGDHAHPHDGLGTAAPGHDAAEDGDVAEELVSRLQLIEEQPLRERAAAFALLHDELRARLEGGDGVAARG